MDPQTSNPATPAPLAGMLHNATIDKVDKSEFNHSARDTIKVTVNNYNFTKEGENLVLESSDVIDVIRNVAQPFLEEVRRNNQSRSTVGESTGDDSSDPVPQAVTSATPDDLPVDITDIVPSSPSSLPVTSIADMYTRSMLKCLRGYALYNPIPFCGLSNDYPLNGVNVGDVGFVRGTGTFDFLFNICPSQNTSINPPNLPDGFSLETPDQSETTHLEPLPPNTRFFQSPVTKTKSGEYICEGSEGAVLELPQGAVQSEVTNARPLAKLAARHGIQWYEYTMNRGRDISNGSLYLITSVTKCAQWGIAVFDRPCVPGQGLKFDKQRSLPFGKSTPKKYRWKGSDTFPTKVSNPDQGDVANQCVFVRGYKIMVRQDIFENLCNDEPRRSDSAIPSSSSGISMTRRPATRIRGGGGPDPASRLIVAGVFSPTIATNFDEEVVLHPNFSSSLVHPSDFINGALLSQNPGAKVALTHDDVWCHLLQDNFPKLNYTTLINIARLYTSTIEYDCISLQKIFDPSGDLEESSRPLQEIATPALTPPDDNYSLVHVPTMTSLPRVLMERILLLLDTKFMLKCRLVNREFNAIIHSSISVKYYLACKAAGVIDNPQSPLSYAERLEALKKREDAWRKLEPVFETTIKVNDEPSTFYDLSAGNYFRVDESGKDLYYCHLPSFPQDNPQWRRIPGHGPGKSLSGLIGDIGMAVYEHDLIANVVCYEVRNQPRRQRHFLDLVLLKFSTGEYHPFARHPLIHIQKSLPEEPYVSVRIVGDNLALVVYGQNDSKLYIFDWKTGHKRLEHNAITDAYEDSIPVFLSPELLLVPNWRLYQLEVWQLFPSHPNPDPPVQILSLQFPTPSDVYGMSGICCQGEPNPFLHSMPYSPPRPFFPSSDNTIIIIDLYLGPILGNQSPYKFIMHRRALLNVIQKLTSPSLLEQQADVQVWSNEVTVHKVTDPEDGSVRLVAQSEQVSADSDASSSSSIPSGPASSTSRYDFLEPQWADWGPPISRWLRLNGTDIWRTRQCNGERYVFLDSSPGDSKKCRIGVADFNLHNVSRNAEMMTQLRKEGEDDSDDGKNGEGKEEENEEDWEILDHRGGFSEEVYMGLKCVVNHLPGEYDFDAVLMDEERLFGLKLNGKKQEESIQVLYFG